MYFVLCIFFSEFFKFPFLENLFDILLMLLSIVSARE